MDNDVALRECVRAKLAACPREISMVHKFRISESKYTEIKQLLDQDMSHRNISVLARVSRSVIKRVVESEKYTPQHATRNRVTKRQCGSIMVFADNAPLQKCGQCGASVKLPCLACQIRSSAKSMNL